MIYTVIFDWDSSETDLAQPVFVVDADDFAQAMVKAYAIGEREYSYEHTGYLLFEDAVHLAVSFEGDVTGQMFGFADVWRDSPPPAN